MRRSYKIRTQPPSPLKEFDRKITNLQGSEGRGGGGAGGPPQPPTFTLLNQEFNRVYLYHELAIPRLEGLR
jgi:hypothetical protein